MSDFSAKCKDVMPLREARLCEAGELIREVAGQGRAGDSVKACLRRIGRVLPSWTPNRIKDVWARDRRVRIRAEEIDELRRVAAERWRRQQNDKAAAHDLAELRRRIEQLESLLEIADPESLGADSVAVRQNRSHVLRAMGASD